MLLPKHKISFTLEQVLQIIKNAESYDVSYYSYIPNQWTFKCYFNNKFYIVILGVLKKRIKYIKIELDYQKIQVDYKSEYSKIFDTIYQEYNNKVLELENNKFSTIFPNYLKCDERDNKIESILELENVSENKPKSKKLLGRIFEKVKTLGDILVRLIK